MTLVKEETRIILMGFKFHSHLIFGFQISFSYKAWGSDLC